MGARPARKDRRLRNLREQWRRQKRQKPWSPQEGREILCAQDQAPYYVGHFRALTEWRAASRLQTSRAILDSRCLSARVLACRASLPLAALAPLAADFVPLPSQHAQLILAWMPDVRPAVQSEMPGVMYSARGQVTADWAQDHQLVDETCSVAVRKESATDRRIRQCREACLCLCSMHRNMAQRMLTSFNNVLHGMLPKRVLGTPSELRDAADNAELFLRVNGNWYYLCFVRWGPTFRPVFLAMQEAYRGDASQPREHDANQLEADTQMQVPHKRLLKPMVALQVWVWGRAVGIG